tara:strand:- start:125 stop:406 length:282 start_codon:yes stop_codon:yes gene_type:complete
MLQFDRKMMIAVILAIVALTWWFRYDAHSFSNGVVFLHDRWTNRVTLCAGAIRCVQIYPHIDDKNKENAGIANPSHTQSPAEVMKYFDDLKNK